MGLFSNVKTDNSVEETQDRLGGFSLPDSDAYDSTIKMAYASKSEGGAQAVNFEFDLGNGMTHRETLWVTNKQGQNYYEKNDKKFLLPGFIAANDIFLAALEKGLLDDSLVSEDKVVKIYDYDARTELPKTVPVFTEILGKPVTLGLVKQLVDKNVKDAAGNYVPSGETREEVIIDKVFHTGTKLTMNEARNNQAPDFYPQWVEKNKGTVRNRAKGASQQGGAAPVAGGASAPAGGARKSLFGNS